MTLLPLYIDPGTGSLLFSIVIGATAAAYFAFRALFIKIKSVLTGGKVKKGTSNKFVIYAEDKRYWTLFKPILEEFEKLKIELLYLTSSSDDPVFTSGLKYIKPELLGEGNRAFARLNLLSADFLLSSTPGLNVYQWKRSKTVKHYSHIFHAADEPVKYEPFGLDYYDSILTTGEDHQKNDIRKLEELHNVPRKELITVGCPYLDENAEKISMLPKELNTRFTVLVSPSWGKSALLSRYGEKLLDPLVKTDWRIIVRPHPQSLIVESALLEKLLGRYKNYSNLEWDYERENIFSINKADIMISDFSGIILDFIFLRNKPVFYVPPNLDLRFYDAFDIYKNQDEMWTFRTLKRIGIELNPEQLEDLPRIIGEASDNISFATAIKEVKDEAWHYRGSAGKNVADYMIKTAG